MMLLVRVMHHVLSLLKMVKSLMNQKRESGTKTIFDQIIDVVTLLGGE